MANTIKLKNSGTSSNVPSSLEYGELAINYADGKLFYKDSGGSIVEFTAAASPAGSDGQVQYNNGGSFGGASGLHYDDGNDRVGIGTTSPATQLQLSGSNGREALRLSGDGGGGSTTGSVYMGFHHWATGTHPSARIGVQENGTADYDGSLLFETRNSDSDVAPSTRMVIDQDGNVGIGTTSPDNKLHVQIGTSAAPASVPTSHMIIADSGETSDSGMAVYSGTNGNGYFRFGDSDAAAQGGFRYQHSADKMYFRTGGSDRGAIDSSGNVGIGTTSPSYQLDVEDGTAAIVSLNDSGGTVGSSTNSRVIFEAGGSTAGQVGFLNTGAGIMSLKNEDGQIYLTTGSADDIIFRPNSTEAMRIQSSGNITSPNHFTAQSGGADGGIVLGQAFSSSYVGLRTAGMSETSGNEYILLSDGNNTFISSGSSGSTYIRGPANDSGNQLRLTGTQNLFSGATYVDGDRVWDRGDLKGGATSVAVNSSGYGTINHGLGATPDFAFVGARARLSNGNDNQLSFPITSYNSTSITFRAYEINGDGNSNYSSSTIFNATVYVFWMVGNQ